MTQNEKDLLLKDLCARLPYKVKVQDTYYKSLEPAPIWLIDLHAQNVRMFADEGYQSIEYIKPYLFPLSSMTEEQEMEISKRYNYHNYCEGCVEITYHLEGYWDDDNSCNLQDYLWLEDWYNKNHFDYRGLIPMGLAIDATGLNIY